MAPRRICSIRPVRISQIGRNVTRAPWTYSEEPWMSTVRIVLATAIVATSCASCADRTGAATSGNSATPAASIAASPTQAVPPYLASYTAEERAAYSDALAAEDAFDTSNARFLAKGKTLKAASDFYHRYSIDWVQDWTNLAELANNHVTVTGKASVVWVRPLQIDLATKSGLSVVVLRRCVDSSKVAVTQNGHPVAQPHLDKRHVLRVRMEKRTGEAWWRSGIAERGAAC